MPLNPKLYLLSLALSTASTFGAVYNTAAQLPNTTYDFIVVGGGTAGSVIASRLSENPNWNVLVIESGPTNEGVEGAIIPYYWLTLLGSQYDWNYTTTPQTGLNDRVVGANRGHILGGSSSINGMFYTRCSSEDYDRFASHTGDSGWSWKNLWPYIKRNERFVPPADHHNTTGQFIPSVHGYNGVTSVSLSGYPRPIDLLSIQTTQELSEEFPYNQDQNSGNPLGLGWLQFTINGGSRSSAATSYLAPNIRQRKNLHILLNARVSKLYRTGSGGGGKPAFRTVEYTPDFSETRTLVNVTASKEVILSAGAWGSPTILMHSGIGDAEELRAAGVTPLVNLPDVGRNLSDHTQVGVSWVANTTDTHDNLATNSTLLAEALAQWNKNHTGPLVSTGGGNIIWSRIPDDSSIFDSYPDPSAGSHTPHFELIIVNGAADPQTDNTKHYIGMVASCVSPASRGSLRINASDPFDQPLIDPGYLTSPFDLFVLRQAIRSASRFLSAPAWKDYVLGPAGAFANVTLSDDDALDAFIRAGGSGASHAVGTCSMSKKSEGWGVVDPDLRVKEVDGVRVVDASVMPFVPAGHTQAPVYIVAERAADLIRRSW